MPENSKDKDQHTAKFNSVLARLLDTPPRPHSQKQSSAKKKTGRRRGKEESE